jgi:hypothetical protein
VNALESGADHHKPFALVETGPSNGRIHKIS